MRDAIGGRIRDRRKAAGLTLDALASKAGISKGYLSDLENGKRGMGADVLLGIGQALGLSMDYLMEGDGAKRDESPEQLRIPSSLASYARETELSFRVVFTLLRIHRAMTAICRGVGDPEGFDWAKFHGAIKDFLE